MKLIIGVFAFSLLSASSIACINYLSKPEKILIDEMISPELYKKYNNKIIQDILKEVKDTHQFDRVLSFADFFSHTPESEKYLKILKNCVDTSFNLITFDDCMKISYEPIHLLKKEEIDSIKCWP